MRRAVVLDTNTLGLTTNPKSSGPALDCFRWTQALVASGVRVVVPEIADYELRRELIRSGKRQGLARLDQTILELEYLPLDTPVMRLAARLWADARNRGRPTASPDELDGDVILAAQALSLGVPDLVVATSNVGHLAQFVPAALWSDIA